MFRKKSKPSKQNGYFELGVVYNDYREKPAEKVRESNEAVINSIREYVNRQEKNEYRANLLFDSMDNEKINVPEPLVYKRKNYTSTNNNAQSASAGSAGRGVNNQNQMGTELSWVKHLDKIESGKNNNKFVPPAYKEDILTLNRSIDESDKKANILDKTKSFGMKIARNQFNNFRNKVNSNIQDMQEWAVNFDVVLTEYPEFVNKLISMGYGEEAAENLLMAYRGVYLNTPYAKQHKIYDNVEKIENQQIRDFMKAKLSKEMGYPLMYKMKGIYVEANSKTALKLIKNKDLHRLLSSPSVKNALLSGFEVNSSINFTDNNFHNAIGKADVIKIKMLPNGAIDMYICDNYNFNEGENDFIIYGPRILEQIGELKPYFAIYHVIIPYYNVNDIFNF